MVLLLRYLSFPKQNIYLETFLSFLFVTKKWVTVIFFCFELSQSLEVCLYNSQKLDLCGFLCIRFHLLNWKAMTIFKVRFFWMNSFIASLISFYEGQVPKGRKGAYSYEQIFSSLFYIILVNVLLAKKNHLANPAFLEYRKRCHLNGRNCKILCIFLTI